MSDWRWFAETMRLGSWELDPSSGEWIVSADGRRLFDLESWPLPLSRQTLLARTHPDDRELLESLFARAARDPSMEPVRVQHRVVRESGEVHRLVSRVAATPASGGGTNRVLAISLDLDGESGSFVDSERTFRELGDAVPALLSIREAQSGRLFYVNTAWNRYLPTPPKVGGDYHQLIAVVHPDDHAELEVMARRSLEGEESEAIVRFIARDGSVVWHRVQSFPIRDARGAPYRVAGFAWDITEQRATEQMMRDSETRYRSVILAMSDGIVLHGRDGEIVAANPSAERMLGLSLDELTGRTSLDPRWRAIREDGSPFPGEEHPGWVTFRTGQESNNVIMGVHRPDGTLRWLSINTRRVDCSGEPSAYTVVASFCDVTERRASEATILASLREKELLLKEIHHRVKNNLQIISSLLFLQSQKVDDPFLAEQFEESQERIASMALVHEQLYKSGDLSQIVFADYARRLGESLLRSHGIPNEAIRFEIEDNGLALPIDVAIPCSLILNELFANAFKHAFPPGRSGTIRTRLERCEGGRLLLAVSDDGIGLPADFDSRQQASLGSKLVERLVDQLRGSMLRSSTASGTRYEIRFCDPGATVAA